MIINDGGSEATGEEASLLLPPGGGVAEAPPAPLLPRGEGGGGRVAHRGDRGHRPRRAAHQAARPPAIQPRILLKEDPDPAVLS